MKGARLPTRRPLAAGLVLALLVAAALAAPAGHAEASGAYVIEPGRSQIRFEAVSRFVNVVGTFGRFGGEVRLDENQIESARARLEVDVASLDTRNRLRDDHLRSEEFFDAERHPRATFISSAVRRDGDRWLVTGQLTIRGVTQPLTVPVSVTAAGAGLRIQGEFTVNRRAFGMSYQSVLNPIRDDIRVWVDLAASPK